MSSNFIGGSSAQDEPAVRPARLAVWLAWRELCHYRLRALLVSGVVALAVAGVLGSFTLAQCAEQARRDELELKPLCLWVGDRSLEDQLAGAGVARLTEHVRGRLSRPEALIGVIPFHEMRFSFFPTGGRDGLMEERGRTIAPDDRLWGHIDLREGGKRLTDPGEAGVVVTEGLLESLGHSLDSLPEALTIAAPATGKPRPVPVVGVARGNILPSGQRFALTASFWELFMTQNPDAAVYTVRSGTGPKALLAPEKLGPRLRAALEKGFTGAGVAWPPEAVEDGDGVRWQLRMEEIQDKKLVSDWGVFLDSVAKTLAIDKIAVGPTFAQVDAAVDPLPWARPKGYHQVGIYVSSPAEVRRAFRAVEEQGLPAYEVIVEQLEQLERTTAGQRRALRWGGVAVALGTAAAVFIVYQLRMSRQAQPIGMLRAMGAPRGALVLVFLAEATALWLVGLVIAAGLVAVFGVVAGRLIGGASAAFAWSPGLVALVVGLSGVASWASILLATWRACGRAPAEALRAG